MNVIPLIDKILEPWEGVEKILVVNRGSSSIKISLFSADTCERLFDANLLRKNGGTLEIRYSGKKSIFPFRYELTAVLSLISNDELALKGIGHRYVHGGSHYVSTTLVDNVVLENLNKINELAPLHNPLCLDGVEKCIQIFGSSTPQALVFDTAFHCTIPEVAANYAIPASLTRKYSIKRYGFHGISHAFLLNTYQKKIKNIPQNSKIITVHLGHGCSMTAIKDGISIDTSMGFTPTEGLIMSTRSGDLDPGIFEYLCIHESKSANEILTFLNQKSGLLGITEISGDMEVILNLYNGNKQARLAVDMFCYRIIKYIGAYIAVLGGVDAIIFSGGIGENSSEIRSKITKQLECFGVQCDDIENRNVQDPIPGRIHKFSAPDSRVALYVIATDENMQIFNELSFQQGRVLQGSKKKV